MRIYRISATQGNISFKQTIKADSYSDARNKFCNNEYKFDSYKTFSYTEPTFINSIARRY